MHTFFRSIAQPGRALRSGRRSRRFKSCYSDQNKKYNMTKIFISGGSGSGKSTYAKKLSKQLDIPYFDLDDIYWITYSNKRPKQERIKLLNQILQNNTDWIIDGVYFQDWIIPIIEQSDKIIIVNTPKYKRQYRIIKRFLSRIFFQKKKNEHQETVKTLFKLLLWSNNYEKKYLPELIKKIKQTNKTYTTIK